MTQIEDNSRQLEAASIPIVPAYKFIDISTEFTFNLSKGHHYYSEANIIYPRTRDAEHITIMPLTLLRY